MATVVAPKVIQFSLSYPLSFGAYLSGDKALFIMLVYSESLCQHEVI